MCGAQTEDKVQGFLALGFFLSDFFSLIFFKKSAQIRYFTGFVIIFAV